MDKLFAINPTAKELDLIEGIENRLSKTKGIIASARACCFVEEECPPEAMAHSLSAAYQLLEEMTALYEKYQEQINQKLIG